jgi:hypothetical protein
MRIFSRIQEAIFGHPRAPENEARIPDVDTRATPPLNVPQPRPHTTPDSNPAKEILPGIPSSPADAKWERSEVDIEQVLRKLAAQQAQQLDWRASIVDLMKLLGIDSSLENRRELARELGYNGEPEDSAAMNTWLHRRVMQELARHGGKVPASLVA